MYQNLLAEAKKEGITEMEVVALVQNERKELLLIEEHGLASAYYRCPSQTLLAGESISFTLNRLLLKEVSLKLKETVAYLGHYDDNKKRYSHFVVTVHDPYAVEGQTKFIYAWVEPKEGVGYPISASLRHMIDIYLQFLEKS